MRAVAWEFPDDPQLAGVDNQSMLGSCLLITPVLVLQAETVLTVFAGTAGGTFWYDWYPLEAVQAEPGVNTTVDAPLGHIPFSSGTDQSSRCSSRATRRLRRGRTHSTFSLHLIAMVQLLDLCILMMGKV